MSSSFRRQVFAEFVGSSLLTLVVVGSGIAAQQLSPGDLGLELLENAIATGAGLLVLILVFAPVSGAHLNPVVSLVDAALGRRPWSDLWGYVPAQVAGCASGAVLANVMFSRAAISLSTHDRTSGGHLLSEVVATLGLLLVIFSLDRNGHHAWTPVAVGSYIASAYFFTSSTSFANPAITVGRSLSNSFAGIAPRSVAGFVAAQCVGALLAIALIRYLYPVRRTS